jgi:hypothetical protein
VALICVAWALVGFCKNEIVDVCQMYGKVFFLIIYIEKLGCIIHVLDAQLWDGKFLMYLGKEREGKL